MSDVNHEYQIPVGPHSPIPQNPIVDSADVFAEVYDASKSSERAKLDYVENLKKYCSEIITARQNKIQTGEYVYGDKLSKTVRSFSKALFPNSVLNRQKLFQSVSNESLISSESEIGSAIFNNQPKENHIVFFLENDGHWYFYQERTEKGKSVSSFTIHYEVCNEGVLKVSDVTGIKGQYISGVELENFIYATAAYHERVMQNIYGKNCNNNSQNAA